MTVLLRILLGLVVMAVGFWMTWKTKTVITWFGRIPWAEQHLGSGGTWTFYKLLGVLVAFIGIFIATNIISDIIGSFAGLFIRG